MTSLEHVLHMKSVVLKYIFESVNAFKFKFVSMKGVDPATLHSGTVG